MRITLSILFLFFVNFAIAQKYSNEFLSIGVGARAQGLANAQVASANDITAGFWNPAALMNIGLDNEIQFGAMHAEWFAGIGKYDYLSAAMPIADNNRVVGLSLIRFGIDDIPNTLSLYESDGTVNYDNIVNFSAADYALLLSYAQGIGQSKNLKIGGNVKIIHRQIGSFANAWGFGLDVGLHYTKGKWQFGLLGKDLTSTFNAWQFNFTEAERAVLDLTNNEIPINSVEITRPSFILGLSRYVKLSENFGLRPELDFRATTDGQRNTLISADPISIDPSFGAEFDYKKFLFLRLGTNNFQQDQDINTDPYWTVEPTIGLGILFKKIRLDYAFTDIGEQRNNTYSHIVSLVFNLKRKEKS